MLLVASCDGGSRHPTSPVAGKAALLDVVPMFDGIAGQTGPLASQLALVPSPSLDIAALITTVGAIPASPTSVGNCIPFGNNTSYGFTGFIYRDIPPFEMVVGDEIHFDLGALNDVDTRRNIYFAVANKNPAPAVVSGINVVSQDVRATAWVQVVTDAQIPLNPKGNNISGDYELTYTATASFVFPGGGFIIGFGGSPPGAFADGGCDQVLVQTVSGDASGRFYSRFFNMPNLTHGTLDNMTGGGSAVALGGFMIDASGGNEPPTVTLAAPATADEGSSLTVTASVADADGDAVKVEWDFDGDGVADFTDNNVATPGSPSHSWTYADNGTATVKVTVTDPDGATATATATITINNVAPTITSLTVPSDPTNISDAVVATATFTDPGTQDTHTASFAWGDGSSSAGVVTELNGSGSASGSHVYASAGLYCITVTVTDKDGGVDSQTSQCVVVFDPDAGFTTGGGYINTSDGKVNYGFNAKYQGTTPTGNTNIQLAAGHFKATSYDWLVVSGNRAQFAGTGTIDGDGSYRFMITIIDGGEGGGNNGDRIRIKVWNSGGVVFDTQIGAPDTAAPTTAPDGGNLQVHSKP